MTVGERIKELRTSKDISQVEFASMIQVSKQTLYKYENNIITNIPSDKIENAAKVLEVSPCQLMGWEKPSSPKEELSKREQSHILVYRSLTDPGKDRVDTYTNKVKSLEDEESDQKVVETFQKRFVARNGNKLSPDQMRQLMDILDNQ